MTVRSRVVGTVCREVVVTKRSAVVTCGARVICDVTVVGICWMEVTVRSLPAGESTVRSTVVTSVLNEVVVMLCSVVTGYGIGCGDIKVVVRTAVVGTEVVTVVGIC